MVNSQFVASVIRDIVAPGVEKLMSTPFFAELQQGKLSIRRLQGWSVQHYLHNNALLKGFALCMVKNAHIPDLYNYFAYQFNEEQTHPDLAKRFGLALGLKEEDFTNATQIFDCFAHTSKTIRGMMLGSPAENRVSGLVDETMVQRYSQEFDICMRKYYNLGDSACSFFWCIRPWTKTTLRWPPTSLLDSRIPQPWNSASERWQTTQCGSRLVNSTGSTGTTPKWRSLLFSAIWHRSRASLNEKTILRRQSGKMMRRHF
jgi:Pyrroloquinoline quinone (Coenzyme PQQ) biosynthesis protein C